MSASPGDNVARESLYACRIAAVHLERVLQSIGVAPEDIHTQAEAFDVDWPERWAYDAWLAWHACRVSLRRAGWTLDAGAFHEFADESDADAVVELKQLNENHALT